MHVRIDPDRCQCTGYCTMIAPHVFELAPDGGPTRVLVPEPGPELFDVVREAEDTCPTDAIVVDE